MRKIIYLTVLLTFVSIVQSVSALTINVQPPGKKTTAIPRDFHLIEGDRFITDLKYNSDDNFMHQNLYKKYGIKKCYLHEEAYTRLMKVVPELEKKNLKIVLWDCFRPLAVQRAMWKKVPDERFVADPAKGSNHNRGIAIDLGLAREDGTFIPMPTGFDDFTEKAASKYKCAVHEKKLCANREFLFHIMRDAGFEPFKTEWWHFQPAGVDVKKYPVK